MQPTPFHDGRSPFAWQCPQCGADIDAPDRFFELRAFALVPHTAYCLLEVACLTCGRVSDVALWIDRKAFQESMSEAGVAGAGGEEAQRALVQRYLQLLEQSRRRWDEFRRLDFETDRPTMDYSSLDLDLVGQRLLALPLEVLATARGLRKSVNGRPDGTPPGMLAVGHFNCLLSVDTTDSLPQPYVLHLSVMNRLTPGYLTPLETGLVLSLFFAPEEHLFLWAQPGQFVPVTHFYLPADSPDVGDG